MSNDCLHVAITDDGICVACGSDISSQEYLDTLPEMPDSALADIGKIILYAEATVKELQRQISHNGDPSNPSLPRLQLVGTQLIRIPHASLFQQVTKISFTGVKKLGYRGSFERWGDLIREMSDFGNQKPESLGSI